MANEGEEVFPTISERRVIPIAIRGLEDKEVGAFGVIRPARGRDRQLVEGGKVAGEEYTASTPVLDEDTGRTQDVAGPKEPKVHAAKR